MKTLIVTKAGALPVGQYTGPELLDKNVSLRDIANMVSRGHASWQIGPAKTKAAAKTAENAETVPRAAAAKKVQG